MGRIVSVLLGVLCLIHCVQAQSQTQDQIQPATEELPVQAFPPITQAPPGDPWRALEHPANTLSSVLAYSFYAAKESKAQGSASYWIVVRRFEAGQKQSQVTVARRFNVAAPFWLYSPQLSPDGQKMLFRFGLPFAYGTYGFFVWDLADGAVKPGPRENLAGAKLLFSPSGRYIAYAKDENSSQLYVYDLQTEKSSFVVQAMPEDSPTWSWTSEDTLIYSGLMEEIKPTVKTVPSSNDGLNWGQVTGITKIYKTSVGGKPQLLIKYGTEPAPSPDGKWILFLGVPDPPPNALKDKEPVPRNGYYIYDRIKKIKGALVPIKTLIDYTFQWTLDSKQIIIYQRDPKKADSLLISRLDLASRTVEQVTSIQAKNRSASVNVSPSFTILSLSHDSRFCLLEVEEYDDPKPVSSVLKSTAIFKIMNLKDGTQQSIAEAENLTGVDWIAVK